MQKRKIQVLGLLAGGIFVEMMMMSFMLGITYGESKSIIPLVTRIVIPQDIQANAPEQAFLNENGGPAPLDDEHPEGSMPSDSDFIPTDTLLTETVQPCDVTFPCDDYPAPVYEGGANYPAPPDDVYYDPIYTPSMPPISGLPPTDEPPTDEPTAEATPIPTSAPVVSPTRTPKATSTQELVTQTPVPQATATKKPADGDQPTVEVPPTNPPPPEMLDGSLVSVRAGSAPRLDGTAGDDAWNAAPAVKIETTGGANQSATKVTLKSVYDDEYVYFMLSWADSTRSRLLKPWEKQEDGWTRLASGEGSDENKYYEDKISLLWPTGGAVENFQEAGCGGACHSGETSDAKPLGAMHTPGDGQIDDLWEWKAARNVGQVDDMYLDNSQYSKENPLAGIHGDSGKGGYVVNQVKGKQEPAYMLAIDSVSGSPGYILDKDKVAMDASRYKPGDRVPSMITAPFEGDRGDIKAAWKYANGVWTLEIRRKLVTGSAHDVQFDNLDKAYYFALATFDNSQIRHANQPGATALQFKK